MKKAFLLLFFLVLSTAVQAQFIKSFGIKTGGTASYQKWEYSASSLINLPDPDTKNGFNIGAFVEFLHLPVFSLVTEVNYIEKGTQRDVYYTTIEDPDGNYKSTTFKERINYLNFTILGKARLDGKICTPYLIAGPKVDFEVSHSGDLLISSSDDFSKTRFGLKAGAGTEIKLFGINFLAEVLWDTDFGSLYKGGFLKITTSSIDFRGGFSIDL
jgi:hypothetical protein